MQITKSGSPRPEEQRDMPYIYSPTEIRGALGRNFLADRTFMQHDIDEVNKIRSIHKYFIFLFGVEVRSTSSSAVVGSSRYLMRAIPKIPAFTLVK